MSFPNIPDIEPVIDIDLCDAVNLLLSSIAMEEMSLSRLMDAERDKIQCALDCCRRGDCSPPDAVQVNRSANDMLKTMIKLQMLLQFKLENVRELMPCTTTASTTTSTTTTTSTSCTCSTAAAPCRCGSLMGTGAGRVTNECDGFFGLPVTLYAFIPGEDERNRSIRYTLEDGDGGLRLFAAGNAVHVAPGDRPGELAIYGAGRLKQMRVGCCEDVGEAAYTLTVSVSSAGRAEFRMRISPFSKPCCEHDSGVVRARQQPDLLRAECCRGSQ